MCEVGREQQAAAAYSASQHFSASEKPVVLFQMQLQSLGVKHLFNPLLGSGGITYSSMLPVFWWHVNQFDL